ncbi:hypothetical protein [Aureivirga marina]|uniref:hypothetical protein n=1 Tax=Aureivirga marina TaxID=1182451 RepID=UPI0018C91BB1|nr:hypothetical protein [Aureivirga marina]
MIGKLHFQSRILLYINNYFTFLLIAIVFFLSYLMTKTFDHIDFKVGWYLSHDIRYTKGIIIEDFYTGDHEKVNGYEYDIVGFEYVYELNGTYYSWISYASTRDFYGLRKGKKVNVVFNKNHPEFSRIHNMSNSPALSSFILYLILILITILLLIINFYYGKQFYLSIQKGVFVKGKFIKQKIVTSRNTLEEVEESFNIAFSYEYEGRKFKKYITTKDKEKYTDEIYELIIHFPENPEKSYLVDEKNSYRAMILKYIAKDDFNVLINS